MVQGKTLIHRGFLGRLIALTTVSALSIMVASISNAWAVQAQVHADSQYYVYTTSGATFESAGESDGSSDKNNGYKSRVTILDFGDQLSGGTGTEIFSGAHVTNAQIKALAENFAIGYWDKTSGADVYDIIAVGTSNYNSGAVTNSTGGTWGNLVDSLNSWAVNNGYTARLEFAGANDMEPSWGGSSSRANTVAWSNGYSAASSTLMVDYGSSDGCPETTHSDGSCNNGWTQNTEYNVSYQTDGAVPFPQIYYASQAKQWTQIAWYGTDQGSFFMEGPLNENALDSSTYTHTQAWDALWSDLNANAPTKQSLVWNGGMHDLG